MTLGLCSIMTSLRGETKSTTMNIDEINWSLINFTIIKINFHIFTYDQIMLKEYDFGVMFDYDIAQRRDQTYWWNYVTNSTIVKP